MEKWNGKNLVVNRPDFVIESDASLTGWGAALQETRTGGPWSWEEKRQHINCLEIMAAHLAIMSFLKYQRNVTVLMLIDNTTAVSYINHLGGTVSPQATQATKALWM